MSNVIAIDIGGTKAAVAIFDETGRMLGRSVSATPVTEPAEAIAGFVVRARRLAGFEQAEAVGLALPAIVDGAGVVSWAAPGVAGWQDADAAALLKAAFGRPSVAVFDGYAATAGEATFGPGRGLRSVAALIVGTGFGAGFWYDGRVIEGQTGVAGAVGWNRWPLADGTLSAPAEDVASGSGILALARETAGADAYADTRAVFRAARRGDMGAREAVRRASTVAGTVAGQIIDLLAPELVVWTGGVGSRADFSRHASRVAQQACQPYAVGRTRFTRSRLGAESSLVGAAALALSARKGVGER